MNQQKIKLVAALAVNPIVQMFARQAIEHEIALTRLQLLCEVYKMGHCYQQIKEWVIDRGAIWGMTSTKAVEKLNYILGHKSYLSMDFLGIPGDVVRAKADRLRLAGVHSDTAFAVGLLDYILSPRKLFVVIKIKPPKVNKALANLLKMTMREWAQEAMGSFDCPLIKAVRRAEMGQLARSISPTWNTGTLKPSIISGWTVAKFVERPIARTEIVTTHKEATFKMAPVMRYSLEGIAVVRTEV